MSKFQAAPVFTDYMVLQRGKNIVIFGTGENGTEVIGELGGFRASGVVRGGKWSLVFPPMGAARYMRLKLMDEDPEDTIRYDNIAIGEVWLADGNKISSFNAAESENSRETSGEASCDVRYYSGGGWQTLTEKENPVCFHFARELARYNDAAIGIIKASDETAPYTVNGAAFFGLCGECDIKNYFGDLVSHIVHLREKFRSDELAFVIGQLPLETKLSGDDASLVREAQMRAYRVIKNTGLAALLDCKQEDCETIGKRIAAQALNLVYGGFDGAFAPTVINAVWRGEIVELHFANALGGFKISGDVEGFEICGDDGLYVPAFADISGERIFLSADGVSRPRGVRYLWNSVPETFVKNGFGLPLIPFRMSID